MSNSISELFIKEALKTESPVTPELINRLTEERTIRLLHAAMGMTTEAVEFLDAIKKFIFYGKDLDLVNIAEELGDSDWYKAIAHDEIGRSFEEIWAMVIKKLQMRYKGNFNVEGAINRELDVERMTMENILYKEERALIESLSKEETNIIRPEKEAGTIFKDDQLEIKIFDQPTKKESKIPLKINDQKFMAIVDRDLDERGNYEAKMQLANEEEWDTLREIIHKGTGKSIKVSEDRTMYETICGAGVDENQISNHPELISCQNCIALLQNGSDF